MNFDLEELKKEQNKLAKKVSIVDSRKKFDTIAGVEQTFTDDKIYSGIVICKFKDFKVLEKKHVVEDLKMSYKPGFLFYREGPAIMSSFNLLETKPDLLLVNGNGILHPRRIGMASQVGILLDTPTIGIAKSNKLGETRDRTIYMDKEAVGYEVQTRDHARPIYVSPGHKISLHVSAEVIKNCIVYPHKLPEPLHLAHKYINRIRKEDK